ncbi:hypothetical protein [uncultured Desulfosarcina sp.]|uniref:hypothetical protein n=1 Tax=uncultured Desulfosarcina sp. TaxID=218289 RepID=UPI0029C9A2A4|nr:hypothetical protein [uncultured Desulfosarcina sp.]
MNKREKPNDEIALLAGVYGVDEEIGQEGSNSGAVEEGSDADMGGSPTITQ